MYREETSVNLVFIEDMRKFDNLELQDQILAHFIKTGRFCITLCKWKWTVKRAE